MDLPEPIIEAISTKLKLQTKRFEPVAGGCINYGGKLVANGGIYFIKWNDSRKFPAMFEAEAKGLELLSGIKAIRIPMVVANDEADKLQYILMEFIDAANRQKNYWRLLGERLAVLHKNTANQFGLDHNNYIGSLHQYNSESENWIDFFVNQRLRVQLDLAIRNRFVDNALVEAFENLFEKFNELLPAESPSLLHGDLWSGNLIIDNRGEPCLIDPAAYYGHREIELAFTRLFGGFDSEFYDSYQCVFPTIKGFENRVEVYNLYPLLVHLNLFGRSYLPSIKNIVNRYS
jgi:fructosamine-3-kinase